MSKLKLWPYDERAAERVAVILGPSSAAAKALVELKERRAEGEVVELFRSGEMFLVGPPLPDLEAKVTVIPRG